MKELKLISHLVFAAYFILCLFFFLERTLYMDSAFFFFNIITNEDFFIAAGRHMSAVPQLIPIFFIKAGFSLKTVIMAYSCSYMILYYIIFLICVYKLKNIIAGATIAMLLCFCVYKSFFHIVTETHQGLVYTCLLYAWLNFDVKFFKNKNMNQLSYYLIAILIIFFCYASHPVTIFTVLFVIVYHAIDKKSYKDYYSYGLIVLVLIIYFWKASSTDGNSYEGGFYESLKDFSKTLPDFFNLYSTVFFLSRLSYLYLPLFLFWLILTGFYVYQKEYIKLFFSFISNVGFLVITCIIYSKGDADIMMERSFMPLSVMVLIPFLNDFYKKYQTVFILNIMIATALVFSLSGIIKTGMNYRERVVYIDKLCAYTLPYQERKFVIEKSNVNMERIEGPWALSLETLIYSTIYYPSHVSTIYMFNDLSSPDADYKKEDEQLFLAVGFWRDWNMDMLNKKYFNLPPGKYKVLEKRIE